MKKTKTESRSATPQVAKLKELSLVENVSSVEDYTNKLVIKLLEELRAQSSNLSDLNKVRLEMAIGLLKGHKLPEVLECLVGPMPELVEAPTDGGSSLPLWEVIITSPPKPRNKEKFRRIFYVSNGTGESVETVLKNLSDGKSMTIRKNLSSEDARHWLAQYKEAGCTGYINLDSQELAH